MSLITAIEEFVRSLVTYRRAKPATQAHASNPALDHVASQLETMNRNTEQDFLGIGSRLMEFLQTASGIASGIDTVVRSTTGEHGTSASATLTLALERCRHLVAAATADRAHLATLRTGAIGVGTVFGEFRQSVASFHVVCTMTRIEAARLGGAGDELGSLTDEVLALARRMQSQVEYVLDAAAAVDRQIAHLALSLRGTNQLLDHLALAIPNVMRSLGAFSAQQAAATELSMQLAQDSRVVSRSIMNAVTSIQFHDITRQQVEHIVAALRHLSSHAIHSELPHSSAAALRLEATQLTSAGDTFGHSVTRLWNDLEALGTAVHGMAAKGRALVCGHGDDSAFFLELQHCLDAIVEAVESHRNAQTTTRTAARDLTESLKTMNAAAGEIRDLDVQLLRVALNANIRAAHLGPRGDTLAVLASTLQELAASASERSQQAADALYTMDAAVALLLCSEETDDDTSLTHTMRATMETLKAASEEGSARLHEIASTASLLGEGIAFARDEFKAGQLFAEAVSLCLGQINALADEAAKQAPAPADDNETLETFARRYTMQSERDVHASVAEGAPRLVAAGDAEFGDDIELF